VFINRTYVISILKDEKQSTYETLFKEIKKKMQVNLVTVLLFLQLIMF